MKHLIILLYFIIFSNIFSIFSIKKINILDKYPLMTSFDTNGYELFKGYTGVLGKPSEAFLKLIAVKNNKKIILPKTTSLKNYVKIKDESEALDFVRLFTDIETHYLFDDSNYIEVINKNDNPSENIGIIDNENYKKFNLFKPIVNKNLKEFIIERCLYNTKKEIFHAIEKVGFDGEYSIEVKKIISKNFSLTYPFYE